MRALLLALVVLATGCQARRRFSNNPLTPEEMAMRRGEVWVGAKMGDVNRSWGPPCDQTESVTAAGKEAIWNWCLVCPADQAMTLGASPVCAKPRTAKFIDGRLAEFKETK
jgi:hypothetical protein